MTNPSTGDKCVNAMQQCAWKSQNELAARLADTCANREGTDRRPNRRQCPILLLAGEDG